MNQPYMTTAQRYRLCLHIFKNLVFAAPCFYYGWDGMEWALNGFPSLPEDEQAGVWGWFALSGVVGSMFILGAFNMLIFELMPEYLADRNQPKGPKGR